MENPRQSTRSALALARQALQVASAALPAYSSRFSKKDFTQWQLFALLCLKQFLKQDYRGLVALLADWSDLRQVLKLKKVPDHSTLCYANKRLGKSQHFKQLQAEVFAQAKRLGLVDERPEIAVDATGLESRHCSRYFVWRRGKRHRWEHWPKLTLATHTQSHLVAGALLTIGPSQDSPQFGPVTRQAARHLGSIDRLLADSGYDAEHNHTLARQRLGIRSTVIALNRRGHGRRWPKTRYRRQMRRRFHCRRYGQRWQSESVNSRIKRRLGSSLSGRTHASRKREALFKVFTHDLMIL
ncbi:MAG TPA: IS5 family transposase [Candidatus Sulfotelmatobacter sp.]|nr:IS5 family transposase [Candidatus Sulfotelmatobacter sp.]